MKNLRSALLAALLSVPLTPVLAAGPEDAGTPRTEPATSAAPTAPAAAAPAVPDFPTTEATVSLLEPAGEQCEWVRLDPLSSKRRVLARLDAGCQGGSTALSRDGKKGVVRFWRGAVSMPIFGRPTFPEPFPSNKFRDRLFLVDLTTGSAEELPLPPEGELIEYGFDTEAGCSGSRWRAAPSSSSSARRPCNSMGPGGSPPSAAQDRLRP